ncbi:GtrA family protein [Nocardia sp. CDC186]|uniref:GtrA family protein n=1 Tax=Nocardia implantans TaxID=3108168 RepID=A0ABU6B1U5_9NOCA|nr:MULTISPECIES: GtrA family protein [unclassified Nocardia]MBF6195779.1 GtrA family protein [Nocardia beijingensis]MEA3531135.1 GtrA family protein [Nocardia sp. CDC192]MEB3513655.1 GtrA family protein [Nocardia sp. CDC186]
MSAGAADGIGAPESDARRFDAAGATTGPGPGVTPAADPGPLLRLVRRQEIAFAVVGMVNTGLGMALTVLWLAVLGDRAPAALAPALAYSVSVVVAFVLHRTLVFRVRGRAARDFVAFVAVNSGGLVLNMVLLQLGVSVLHLPSIPSAVGVMALVAGASFFGHRHISFRRTSAAGADGSRSGPAGR